LLESSPAALSGNGTASTAGRSLPPAAAVRRRRYTSAAQPLLQDPRLLLFAAAGLVALIFLLRVVLGPAAPSRSSAVVVQVPEASGDELTQIEQQAKRELEQLSEAALIGGNIPRPSQLTAAQRRVAARASQNDQVIQSDRPQPTAAGDRSGAFAAVSEPAVQRVAAVPAAPVGEPVDDRDAKNVPTVNAGSVRGGLARAASNRQAAAIGGTNVSAVNANDGPDADDKAKGRALFKAGRYTEAVEAYQRATKRDSTDASAFAGLGGSLLAKGETRRAITAYQRAVRLQPDVSGFQAALGRAYLQKGDRPRARAAYAKALSLDPKNQAARNGLANSQPR